MIVLRRPLKEYYVNQPFGANYVDFYQKLGLLGHNGTDLKAFNGTDLYSCHDGVVYYCGTDSDGGVQVDIWNKEGRYKTIYYHLKDYIVKQGQQVKAGELIGHCDNTGKYTTGNHLHLGMKMTNETGSTINWDNGYKGAIDPEPYMTQDYLGNNLKEEDNMKLKKIKGEPHIYLVDDVRGVMIMVVDIETMNALGGKYEEVDSLAGYIPSGTLVWVNRVIN